MEVDWIHILVSSLTKVYLEVMRQVRCILRMCPVKGEEPEKEAAAPAASVKKQPPVQENIAAIQPVKTAAAEVSGANV